MPGSITDGNGNTLLLSDLTTDNRIILKLDLRRDNFQRNIGYLRHNVYVKKENKDGIFRQLNAFGFCAMAINQMSPQLIIVNYMGKDYVIGKEAFDKNKKFLNFKKDGFELRCFVPLKYFKRRRKHE